MLWLRTTIRRTWLPSYTTMQAIATPSRYTPSVDPRALSQSLGRGYDSPYVVDAIAGDASRSPRPRYVYSFDGVDDYVRYPNALRPDYVTIFTRIKTNDNKAVQFIAGDGDTGARGYWLGITWSSIRFSCGNGMVNNQLASSVNPVGSDWYTVAGTYDGTTQRIYINGGLRNQSTNVTWAINYDNLAVRLQRGNIHGMHGSRFRHGEQAELLIRDRALTAQEIRGVHDGVIPPNGLILYDPWDVWSGTVAYDVTDNPHHGTITATSTTFHTVDNSIPVFKTGAPLQPLPTFTNGDFSNGLTWRDVRSNMQATVTNGICRLTVWWSIGSTANNWFGQPSTFNTLDAVDCIVKIRVKRVSGTWSLQIGNAYDSSSQINPTTDRAVYTILVWPSNSWRWSIDHWFAIGWVTAGDVFDIDRVTIDAPTDMLPSRQNTLGYNLTQTGGIIPARNATTDATGNPLQYTWQVSYRPRLVQSHCVTLDGIDDAVTMFDADHLNTITGDITVSMLLYIDPSDTGSIVPICKAQHFSIIIKPTENTISRADGSNWSYSSYDYHSYVKDIRGKRARISARKIGNTVSLWLDGKQIVSRVHGWSGVQGSTSKLHIGRYSTDVAHSSYVKGQFSCVRIDNSGLSHTDIGKIHNNEPITTAPYELIPLAEWGGTTISGINGAGWALVNATSATARANTQDHYHYNIQHDYSRWQNKAYKTNGDGWTTNNVTRQQVSWPYGWLVAMRISPANTTNTIYRAYVGGQWGNTLGEWIVARVRKGVGNTYTMFRYTGADIFAFDFQTGTAMQGTACDNIRIEQKHDGWYRIAAHCTNVWSTVPQWWIGDSTIAPNAGGNAITDLNIHADIFWASVDDPSYEPVLTNGTVQTDPVYIPRGDAVKAGNRHNGAETKLEYPACPAIQHVQDQLPNPYLLNTDGTPRPIWYDEFANIGNLITYETVTHGKSNLTIYPEPQ